MSKTHVCGRAQAIYQAPLHPLSQQVLEIGEKNEIPFLVALGSLLGGLPLLLLLSRGGSKKAKKVRRTHLQGFYCLCKVGPKASSRVSSKVSPKLGSKVQCSADVLVLGLIVRRHTSAGYLVNF
jgi:hypothetical protein